MNQADQLSLQLGEDTLSVSQVTQRLSQSIAQSFPLPFWVKGEISNYKGRNQKGHLYFNLIDENSLLPAVMFARQSQALPIELSEGMEVLAMGMINLYAPHGKYQLVIERLLPGEAGQLHLRFEKLKKMLESQGLFAQQHKKPLPPYPQTIGIITSATGAVIHDMLRIIQQRYPLTRVLLCPTAVQGDSAAQAIASAIAKMDQENDVEVIILARGGGSIEDLWPFNEEVVARAIFAAKTPLISAVGHETDFTISDFVADVRAATPTHAAQLATPDLAELKQSVAAKAQQLFSYLLQAYTVAQKSLQQCRESAGLRLPQKRFIDLRLTLDRLCEQMQTAYQLQQHNRQLALKKSASTLMALNPLQVLKRGFALVQGPDGHLVRQGSDLDVGTIVDVRLWQGGLECEVKKIR